MTISEIVKEIEVEQLRLKEQTAPGWPASLDRVCFLVKELANRVGSIEYLVKL